MVVSVGVGVIFNGGELILEQSHSYVCFSPALISLEKQMLGIDL